LANFTDMGIAELPPDRPFLPAIFLSLFFTICVGI